MAVSATRGKYASQPQESEPGDPKKGFAYLLSQGKEVFPPDYYTRWENACLKLYQAGYGVSIPLSYARNSLKLITVIHPESVINLANTVSIAAIRVSRSTAELLPVASVYVAEEFQSTTAYDSWLNTIINVIKNAPESVIHILENTKKIISTLSSEQFHSWVITGLRSTDDNVQRQIRYFSFADSDAEKWLRHEAGDIVFTDIERQLKLYLISLWNLRPPIRDQPLSSLPLSSRRISISNGVISMPEVFPGFKKDRAKSIFRAGIAHAGAHLKYSTKKFALAELRPIQVALVSLLEDARVEYLAMQEFPGLKNIWLPFHVAKSSGPKLVPNLLARLSRALIDNEYKDPDGWVQKGRDMFYDLSNDMGNSNMCRKIGVLLGNDLGQLRAQFNAKNYVVQPPYRDDNMGLWDFGDQQGSEEENDSIFIEAMRLDTQEDDSSNSEHENQNKDEEGEQQYSARECDDSEVRDSDVAVRYSEYDYLTNTERPNWTCVVEYYPDFGDPYVINRILEKYSDLVNRIKNLIQAAKVSLPDRLHHQEIGESLDIDACVNATISRRMGQIPDSKIYSTTVRKHRDLSILVLLDISHSTNDIVKPANASVLDLEIQATTLLAYAMSELNDPFAIAAFCSDGKEDVHYYRIKNFNAPYDDSSRANLAGLSGKLSTRIGAAMRHAINDLSAQHTHRRLLLVITDGEPSDIDVKDSDYLVEDARSVVRSATRKGIDTFCVGLDSGGNNYLHRIFNKKNVMIINKIDLLPERLPMLYLRLTA
mgnify:FL=1|tara:strand:+ start:75881 stop:78181 length:2301 start_codon:yes stop_codon:yes gene_type:complete